jgi:hypothetical protein
LYEVTENNDLGRFFINSKGTALDCNLGEQHCASLEEWDRLVAPYMER